MSVSWASSEEETAALGAELARSLPPGAIVEVRGPLGAGKTVFVRGAVRALGVTEPVTSPTFSVAHLYAGSDGPVGHLDLYRSERLDEAAWGDLEAYVDGVRAAFVEWPDAADGLLPPAFARADLAIESDGRRRVTLSTILT